MVINGTSKIKGVIDLPSIKQQLKKGQLLHIRNNDYWNNDIQMAIKMGFITSTDIPNDDDVDIDSDDTPVRCKNSFHRSIGLNQSKSEIKPGQEFTLTRKELEEKSIRAALSKGMITIVSEPNSTEETTVNITKSLSAPDDGINMSEPEVTLDTNEEISIPSKLIEPKTIKDQKKVIWNAKPGEEIASKNTSGNVDPKQHTIIAGRDGPKDVAMKRRIDMEEDISFVDKEEDADRIQKHPVLKNKPLPQNEEVSPIAEDPTETRRKNHPVLGKKEGDAEDQAFIEI